MSRTLHLGLCDASASKAVGLCAVPLQPQDGKAPEWVQLFPVSQGEIKPNDGRPAWTIADAAALLAASGDSAPIDYDHRTQLANDSKAAAHMQTIRVGGPSGESGIWAKVNWTRNGGEAVASREYRFLSPAFLYDEARRITKIIGAALTNNPALDELPALASKQENNLDPLKQIAIALGLADTATVQDVLSAISTWKNSTGALASRTKYLGEVAAAAGLSVAGDKLGENEITAICTKLKAKPGTDNADGLQKTVDDLQKEVATLSSQLAGNTAKSEVERAIVAGKVVPAQKEWALGYCARDPEGFRKFIGSAPVILKDGKVAREDLPAEGELDEEQLAMCARYNLKPEEFKANMKTMFGKVMH